MEDDSCAKPRTFTFASPLVDCETASTVLTLCLRVILIACFLL